MLSVPGQRVCTMVSSEIPKWSHKTESTTRTVQPPSVPAKRAIAVVSRKQDVLAAILAQNASPPMLFSAQLTLPSYVRTLELQQFKLVTGLQTMYSMLLVADAWPGHPLPATKGHPLVHDMLERLDLLQLGDMELEIEDHGSDDESDAGSLPRIQQNRGPSPTVRPRTSTSPRLGGNCHPTTAQIPDLELGGWQPQDQSQSWSSLSQFQLPKTDFTLRPPPKMLVPLHVSEPIDILGWSAIDYMPPWWLGNLQPRMSNAVTSSVITTAQGDAYSAPAGFVNPTADSTYLVDPGKYGCDFEVV
ncbi:hypothetical protein E4T42_09153 [Aureobasidium subglaciale]|nr:hypothetical protein E4T42_09153 [Aureobasidium subglaciale]